MELFATQLTISLDEVLHLPLSKVAEIDRNYSSPTQRREAYLDLYVTAHPCPDWKQIAEALSRVGFQHKANVVESTYVQGTRMIPMHPLSVTIVRFKA